MSIETPSPALASVPTAPTEVSHAGNGPARSAGQSPSIILQRLQDASESGEGGLLDAVRLIDWNGCSVEESIRAIDLALAAGSPIAARKIASEARQRFSENSGLQQLADALAPPEVLGTRPPSDIVSRQANQAWLRQHSRDYPGRWVALRSGDLVGEGASLREIKEQLGSLAGLFVARIDNSGAAP